MENLSEKLKQVGDESFETWFERWYKKRDIEHSLVISSSQGFNKLSIFLNKENEYIRNRILDERFIPKMKKMLGPNIEVSSQVESRKNIFGRRIEERIIVIKW